MASWCPPITQPMLTLALEMLQSVPGPHRGLLLDLGAGHGPMAAHFEQIGYRVTCVDLDPLAVAGVRRRMPAVQGLVADAESLPFDAGSFSAVYCNSVLQYVNRERVLVEIRRVLRPSGYLVAIENLHGSPVARIARAYLAIRGRRVPPHLNPRRHLRRSELSLYRSLFRTVESRAYNLLSTGAIACRGLPERAIPAATAALRPLHAFDRLLFRAIPALEHLAWHLVIRARK